MALMRILLPCIHGIFALRYRSRSLCSVRRQGGSMRRTRAARTPSQSRGGMGGGSTGWRRCSGGGNGGFCENDTGIMRAILLVTQYYGPASLEAASVVAHEEPVALKELSACAHASMHACGAPQVRGSAKGGVRTAHLIHNHK